MTLPANFNPSAGTSGRVRSFLLAPLSTLDYSATPGTGTTLILGNLTKWSTEETGESPELITFESEVNGAGQVCPEYLQGGIWRGTLALEGVYDASATAAGSSDYRLRVGCQVLLDLIMNKWNNFGYYGVRARITGGGAGTEVGSGTASFRRAAKVCGAMPLPSFGT